MEVVIAKMGARGILTVGRFRDSDDNDRLVRLIIVW